MKYFYLISFFIFYIFKICKADDCKSYYEVKEGDYCEEIAVNNEISDNKLRIFNSGINCQNIEVGSIVCVDGELEFLHYTGEKEFNSELSSYSKTKRDNRIELNNSESKVPTFTEVLNTILPKEESTEFEIQKNKIEDTFDIYMEEIKNFGNFKIDKCKNKCQNFYKEYIQIFNDEGNPFNIKTLNLVYRNMNISPVNEELYLNICLSTCFGINEIKTIIKMENKNKNVQNSKQENQNIGEINNFNETNEFVSKLSKRSSFNCKDQYKYITVGSPDKYGIRYFYNNQWPYSIHLDDRYVDGFTFDTIEGFKEVFEPAGYGHDSCYFCMSGKEDNRKACDEELYSNMKKLCDRGYRQSEYYSLGKVICKGKALLAYEFVRALARSVSGYNWDQDFTRKNRHNSEVENNYLATYCVCDKFDKEYFQSKLYLKK